VKRIFDPIHHFIELDDTEIALLDTAPMQRLRRLRQLGLAYLAFPAAEHSRFSHALGALATGERVFDSLRRHDEGYFKDERDYREQRRLLRVSLLLHDIGHGPFSHACEAVLGIQHEERTKAILALPEIASAIERTGIDIARVTELITADPATPYPVLRELVSGPNLDSDRMDYLLRDAYFTGVVNGRYDSDQLIGSLRVLDRGGAPVLGVDSRGLVALESFLLARYMMFSTVYFHHTTRQYERTLQQALRFVWPDPRELDPVEAFLAWDDFRVLDAMRTSSDRFGSAIRNRTSLYALVAEFNAEADSQAFHEGYAQLRARYGDAVWADSQEQLMHRLPLVITDRSPTVLVQTRAGTVDARQASDLIRRITGKVLWRKLFVERNASIDIAEARRLAANRA
jgi:HD superfamily phosphohydrolase